MSRPFHHGNLRAVLLDEATAVLREHGADALSLRDLARRAGVSHGAPRSHFVDRRALLDALAERGFLRLAETIRKAAESTPDDFARSLHAAGSAYVAFAAAEPALLDLMFAAKVDSPSETVHAAAAQLFLVMSDIMATGVAAGVVAAHEADRLALLLSATVQGIAGLVTSRRITVAQSEPLIADAIALFLFHKLPEP
ncbi:TetR/AcrR family transcriptional regulator [Actinocorallia sp. A-T 12471]|uniref:TetR/AcrR family transcriptional regulator n=1 Tax=Actinocorallia sp. A-T 12471 TaxID=3089813 RepID=UPI0029D04288|nr:TetR/AcrR family transcriptional regulator [Actinocorallia sp. A-T 12471]MDX6740633.1 TetR/AcrR family transcriptional regulator [Actinocorallia sp. A-T 12471]